MKKLILSACMLLSISASAADLGNDQVSSPEQDAKEVTAMLADRGATLLTPVTCKISGTATEVYLNCGVSRRVAYPDGNIQDENMGCMFEYVMNANGQGYTRTTWECPIL